jgi:hypothetical protein
MTLFDTKGRITIVTFSGRWNVHIPATIITADGELLFEFISTLIPFKTYLILYMRKR